MRAASEVSLHEAAARLGVHYMTAYRYVRLGLLPARKVGAVWRVQLVDVEGFRRQERPAGRFRRAPWARRYESRLLAGDAPSAWAVVESALAAGAGLQEVYLDILAPAMAAIGDRWATGEIDVAAEHHASVITTGVMARLAPRFSRRGRSRGTFVIGAAPGERHAIPVTLVADLVRAAGYAVTNLGADVPARSLAAAAARTDRLVAVGISATTSGTEAAVAGAVEAVRSAVDVPVLVGGAAVPGPDAAEELGADGWAPDARLAIAALEAVTAGGNGRHR